MRAGVTPLLGTARLYVLMSHNECDKVRRDAKLPATISIPIGDLRMAMLFFRSSRLIRKIRTT